MCQLAGVSRASYYRYLEIEAPAEAEMEVRVVVQDVVLAHHRRYGYRRVTVELHRRGMRINHKRVLRIMCEDNLLAIRHRKYILTTDSKHDYPVYVNLAVRMKVTGVNQLWVTDITYIRLRTEFVYLAVVLDRYSRNHRLVFGPDVGRPDRRHGVAASHCRAPAAAGSSAAQ